MADDHKHGEMNIEVQEKTFEGFVKVAAYTIIGSFAFLIFVAMING
ncbi:MAG: aa3-type cytochrome c oxidase subunit IV [Pseudomonadota bacterium]